MPLAGVPLLELVLPGMMSVVTVVVKMLDPFGPMLVVSTVVVVGIGEGVEVVDKLVELEEPRVSVAVVDDGIGTVSDAERLASPSKASAGEKSSIVVSTKSSNLKAAHIFGSGDAQWSGEPRYAILGAVRPLR